MLKNSFAKFLGKQNEAYLKLKTPRIKEDGILEQNQMHLTKIDRLIKEIQESVETLKTTYNQASKNLETVELDNKICKCKQDFTIPREKQAPAVNPVVTCSCNRLSDNDCAITNFWCKRSKEILDPAKTFRESTSAQSDVINLKPRSVIFESISACNCDETDYTLFSIQSLEPSFCEIYKQAAQDTILDEKLLRSSEKEHSHDSKGGSKSSKPKIKTFESASKSSTKSAAQSPSCKREFPGRAINTRPKPGVTLKKPKREFQSKPPLKLAEGDSKSKTPPKDRSKSKGTSTSKESVYSGRSSIRGTNTATRPTSSTKNSQSTNLPIAMKIDDKETQKNMIEKEEIEIGVQSVAASSHHTKIVDNKVQTEEGTSFNSVHQLKVISKAQSVDENKIKKSKIQRDLLPQTSLCSGVECNGFCFEGISDPHRKAPISPPNDSCENSMDIIYLKEIKIKRKHSSRSQVNRSRVETISQGNDNREETNTDTISASGLMHNKETEPPVDKVEQVSINQEESNRDKCFGKCSLLKKPQLEKSTDTTQTFAESEADGVVSVSSFPQTSTQTLNPVRKSSSITCPNSIKNGSILYVECQCKSIKINKSENISQSFTPSANENVEMSSQTSKSSGTDLTLNVNRQTQVLENQKPTTNINQEISVEEPVEKDPHKIKTKICNGTTQTRMPIIIPGENKVLEFYSYPDSSQSTSKSTYHNASTFYNSSPKANARNKEILKLDSEIEIKSDFLQDNDKDVATEVDSSSLENLSASPKHVSENYVTDHSWAPDTSKTAIQDQTMQQNVREDFEVNRKRSSSSYCSFKKSRQNKPASKRSGKSTGSHFVDSQRLTVPDGYICTEACPYVRELQDTGASPIVLDGITDRNLLGENVYSSEDIPSVRLILSRPQSRFDDEEVNARLENISGSTPKAKLKTMSEKYFQLPEDESNTSRRTNKCLCSVSEMARYTKQQQQSFSVSRSLYPSEKELEKCDLDDSNMYFSNENLRKRIRCESFMLNCFSADQVRCRCDQNGNAKLMRSVRHFQGISTGPARNGRPPETLFANELHQNIHIVKRTRNYENWITYYLSPL